MSHSTLKVQGMHCSACVARVERALRSVPGVQDAGVDLLSGEAAIVHAQACDLNMLEQAVVEAGFRASRVRPDEPPWGRRAVIALPLAGAVMALAMFGPHEAWSRGTQAALTIALQAWIGTTFLRRALAAARHRSATMDTLISLGSLAATTSGAAGLLTHRTHLDFESAAMILALVSVGRWLEARARRGARDSIAALMASVPAVAIVEREGREVEVRSEDVRAGEVVIVRPGSAIAVDGVVAAGDSNVDESSVTGEPLPARRRPGDAVFAGTLSHDGVLRVRASAAGRATLVGQIAETVRRARASKGEIQRTADRAAGVVVPVVLVLAGATLAAWGLGARDWSAGLRAAIAVLVVTCPCAIGLAVPTAVSVALAVGARLGVLVRDAGALERAGDVRTVAFDKTGTLTIGRARVVGVTASGDEREFLRLVAGAERSSEHPIGRAIVAHARALGIEPSSSVANFRAVPGEGVHACVEGLDVRVGRPEPGDAPRAHTPFSTVRATIDSRVAGEIALADEVRPEAREGLDRLRALGLRVVMLTGDQEPAAREAARALAIGEFHAGLRPFEKQDRVRALQGGGRVAMVGDGINDAAALAEADVGMAMGTATDLAKRSGDLVLLRADVRLVADAIRLGRAMSRRVRVGLAWAFAYNAALVPLAALGRLDPMLAAGAMGLSSVSVVLNALALTRFQGEGSAAGRRASHASDVGRPPTEPPRS